MANLCLGYYRLFFSQRVPDITQIFVYVQYISNSLNKYQLSIDLYFFERGASEAAAGCLASVAAKLVKTAIETHIYMRVKINHRRQIWDILVRFLATQEQPSTAKLLSALELQNIELIK